MYTNTSMETTERTRKRKASISCSTYRYYFNSNGTNLWHGCCTLPPFPSTLMSLCTPVLVESIKSHGDTAMEPWLVDVYTCIYVMWQKILRRVVIPTCCCKIHTVITDDSRRCHGAVKGHCRKNLLSIFCKLSMVCPRILIQERHIHL